MSDAEPHLTVKDQPEVGLTPLDLAGEPDTDHGYVTPSGLRLRARIITIGEQETRAPTNGDEAVAPSGWTLSLTFAVLDAGNAVARDVDGKLLIMDRREIVLGAEALGNAAFDPQAAIEQSIAREAAAAETQVAKRAALTAYLASAWGGAKATTSA